MDKLSAETIDKACQAFTSLPKWTGSQYNKNEKIIELHPFVQAVLSHPALLYSSPFKKKERLAKIS